MTDLKHIKKLFLTCFTAVTILCTPHISVAGELLDDIQIHGFISQGFIISDEYHFMTHDSKNGSFQFNELGINFSKKMNDKLHVGMQFFSRDIGDAANNDISVSWGYGDYHWKDWLGIRVGRIKAPFLMYAEYRDEDMLRTNIIMPQALYLDLVRDANNAVNGVGLYGNISIGSAGDLDYQIMAGGVSPDMDSGLGKYFNHALYPSVVRGDADYSTVYVTSLNWNTPLDGLKLNFNTTHTSVELPITVGATDTTFDGKMISFMTYGVEYTWEDLVLAGEYFIYESDTRIVGVTNYSSNTSTQYYLSASYRFTDLFEMGIYYAVDYPNSDDKDGNRPTLAYKSDAWMKDLALSFRFDISEHWIFKIEGHKVNGTSDVIKTDNLDRTEDDWYYGAAKLTFSF